ncbi:MAG: alpha/beta fold hydrolase [Pseudohongiella sp.]|uniref:alpha/beta hydrolase n=1 Tax=Pseudohongiella sp. TaxID=1979412 RepID=UPI0034A0AEE7
MPNLLLIRFLFIAFLTLGLPVTAFAQQLPTKHIINSDGHPMALWEKSVADPKGHILLHHGRTWSALPDFDLQVPGEDLSLMAGFNALGYSVWALDARGYGSTPRDASDWHTPDKAAMDLAVVLDWLQERTGQKINVWGWSYGSMVAQLTAQRFPQAIRSVTLFGYPTDPDADVPVVAGQTEPERRQNTAEAAASDFIVPGSISEAAIAAFVDAALAADPIRADWNQLHQWNALDGEALDVPVMLLQAEFDPLANTDAHARFFVKIANPNKQWVVLAGGDHAALLETPRARLIQASVDFIEWLGL